MSLVELGRNKQAALTALVKASAKPNELPEEDVKLIIQKITENPSMFQQKTGGFAKAVNTFVKGWNTIRLRKPPAGMANTARGQEKHQPLLLPNGSMTVARFSGPGTELIKRIREQQSKGSLTKDLQPVDVVAQLHDVQYALAADEDDPAVRVNKVRDADKLMVKRIAQIAASGKDSKYNTVGGALIAAKIALEEGKVLSADKFAPAAKLSEADRKLYQEVESKIKPEVVGYGKLTKIQKGNGAGNKWAEHVKKTRAKHSGMSFKDALKEASKTYKK